MGGTFIARRVAGRPPQVGEQALMHTGYYVGVFLAAIAELLHWREIRLAGNVPGWRNSSAVGRIHSFGR